jgi:putative ABC transport system ATP-binding protein
MLELRNVAKRYTAGSEVVHAIEDVSLTIEPGEVVALYGPSGSGKTTLLLLAAGMTEPDEGAVLYKGRSVGGMSAKEATRYLRSELGVIWQKFQLIPVMSALDNAGIKLVAGGASRRAARKQAAPWLDRVGLRERVKHPPERLSIGEQQRVAIARALVNKPGLILADEPTGSLDTSRAEEVLGLLADISHREGVGVLLVTHDPDAAAFADRAHALRDGKLLPAFGRRPGEDEAAISTSAG